MGGKTLIIGVIVGISIAGVALGYVSTNPSVNADKVCQDRFGPSWTGEQINTNWRTQSVTLNCTNGTKTETIGVDVSVEVDA